MVIPHNWSADGQLGGGRWKKWPKQNRPQMVTYHSFYFNLTQPSFTEACYTSFSVFISMLFNSFFYIAIWNTPSVNGQARVGAFEEINPTHLYPLAIFRFLLLAHKVLDVYQMSVKHTTQWNHENFLIMTLDNFEPIYSDLFLGTTEPLVLVFALKGRWEW